jgi:hypothetical protein
VLTAEGAQLQADRPLAGTKDIADFLCAGFRTDKKVAGEDVRMSTAALLSARFPFVSPTGALTSCDKLRGGIVHTFAVDGGYVDSSASSPLVELFNALIRDNQGADRPCIQPVVLQIDNSYETLSQPSPPARPAELLAPYQGQGAATSGHTDASLQALAQLAATPRCDLQGDLAAMPTYLHVYPEDHPGAQAPLGWSLSRAAQKDLDTQLGRVPNQCALLAARAWLARSAQGIGSCARLLPNNTNTAPTSTSGPAPFADYRVCRESDQCNGPPIPGGGRCDTSNEAVCTATADGAGTVSVVLKDSRGWKRDRVSLGEFVRAPLQRELPGTAELWWSLSATAAVLLVVAFVATKNRKRFREAIDRWLHDDPSIR